MYEKQGGVKNKVEHETSGYVGKLGAGKWHNDIYPPRQNPFFTFFLKNPIQQFLQNALHSKTHPPLGKIISTFFSKIQLDSTWEPIRWMRTSLANLVRSLAVDGLGRG